MSCRTGDVVVAHLTGSLADGQIFLDTRTSGGIVAFQVGIENTGLVPFVQRRWPYNQRTVLQVVVCAFIVFLR
jgi:hypothetical protein